MVRAVLLVVAAVLTVGSVLTLVVTAWRISSVRVITDGRDLPADMRALTIDASDATVRITTDPKASQPRVDLRSLNSERGAQPSLQVTSDAEGTEIVLAPGSQAFMGSGRTAQLTITLPPQLAKGQSVTARQDDGTLIVDADLKRLVARTSDGDIMLGGSSQRIDITTEDGDVVAHKPLSVTGSFSAETVDGDVTVQFGAAVPQKIDAFTRDGDIAIVVPEPGPYLVESESGDTTNIRVPETTNPDKAVSAVTVRSDYGNIAVRTAAPK
jgi:hypothetical protein